MLCVTEAKSNRIRKVWRQEDRLYLCSDAGTHRLEPRDSATVRVTYTLEEEFGEGDKPGVVHREVFPHWDYTETPEEIRLQMEHLEVVICRDTAAYRYYDGKGRLLLRERDHDSKTLEEFTTYRMLEEGARVEKVATPDGVKDVVREASRIPQGKRCHTRLYLEWGEGEALYGLGQQEEGFGSLRGQTVYLHQANRKIAIPMLASTLGYGILVDTYSPMIFSDTVYGSYLYTEADPEMDFYFMNGGSLDGVVQKYRMLTGKTSLLPRWAYGYIQSQERYETQEEVLAVMREYRDRGIGLDGLVLDWCSWEGDQWGQKTFDGSRFPDPGAMVRELHEAHVHFMLSIWPNMGENTDNYRQFKEKKLLLPGCGVYNALSGEARELYWEQIQKGLLGSGLDAWWCDNSEPFTPEWNHTERVEPARMYEEYCQTVWQHLPAEKMNAYGLYHARTIFEGQRGCDTRRVVNLTRSAYTGQQRYGAILWSGDIEASWDTLRRQVAAGLHFSASGLPFWTVDIGAFFVKRGTAWFWKGDYPRATQDLGYRELFVRWYQWGCFLPVFRGHGTDCRRELWHFANDKVPFYEALLAANRLRYTLFPYIYSLAGRCWLEDGSMMRLLAFAYPGDREVWGIMDQYLFGDSIMVCPVLEPMYYGRDSEPLSGIPAVRRLYLPQGNGWYDYWTNVYYQGGQWIETEAPLDRIPLFVREGSILPRAAYAPSTEELSPELEVFVYTGRDGEFLLYEDRGDGYGYEQGEYRTTALTWNEEQKQFRALERHACEDLEQSWTINRLTLVSREGIIWKEVV